MTCDHSGAHSGATRYLSLAGQLRLVLVCDRCGAERVELGTLAYRPHPRRSVGHPAGLSSHDLDLSAAMGWPSGDELPAGSMEPA
jgi:hypothetical protein